jgi:hypothetical protein
MILSKERELRVALLDIYRRYDALGYRPTGMLDLMRDYGAIGAVKRLIANPISEGFKKLALLDRLDLAGESLALQERAGLACSMRQSSPPAAGTPLNELRRISDCLVAFDRRSRFSILKKLKILRKNQAHRSASSSRQRIDRPEGLTTRLVPVEVDLKQQIFDVCSSLNKGHSPKGRLRQLCAITGSCDPFSSPGIGITLVLEGGVP